MVDSKEKDDKQTDFHLMREVVVKEEELENKVKPTEICFDCWRVKIEEGEEDNRLLTK